MEPYDNVSFFEILTSLVLPSMYHLDKLSLFGTLNEELTYAFFSFSKLMVLSMPGWRGDPAPCRVAEEYRHARGRAKVLSLAVRTARETGLILRVVTHTPVQVRHGDNSHEMN